MNGTMIKRNRKAEFAATQTINNVRRFGVEAVGEAKVWEALHRIGFRDGSEILAAAKRCGGNYGGLEAGRARGQREIENIFRRPLTEAEAEAYGLGYSGGAYRD